MDPFNIKVKVPEQVSLTVLPTDDGYYKIIYYAAVLTALEKTGAGDWNLVDKENIEAGDLPYYTPAPDSDHIKISLDDTFAKEAGAAIDNALNNQD
jgi:hypothetical protein